MLRSYLSLGESDTQTIGSTAQRLVCIMEKAGFLSCDQVAIFSGGSELNWRQVGDLPTVRKGHRASVVDGTIYVTGGASNGNNPPSFCSRPNLLKPTSTHTDSDLCY